ncbi:UDP-N-acetylglucosamine 2-epimerase [Corynebacterium renale]|uniref:UDP-N-acetylglucosamine 2-epimerase n=1 Tax=Corynebacterium renale TaxID=1724 RepID=UPI00065344C8|nr:UDP-N-acetylglucosamine 2-epimerase [Corynebacterium renale]SQI19069.1 UDP-N-acetylglucosamine 2-epimerase [Corynebacterium renale]STC97794.1 UDP-N-acetylglucosamine 2-epimerase [Corynebacterium renale]
MCTADRGDLFGAGYSDIVAHTTELLTDEDAYHSMANAVNPYGDGQAAKRVVAAIAELLGVGKRLPDFTA